jgi:hypothetical protein
MGAEVNKMFHGYMLIYAITRPMCYNSRWYCGNRMHFLEKIACKV